MSNLLDEYSTTVSADSRSATLATKRVKPPPPQLPATFMRSINIEPTVLPPMV